MNRTSLFRIRGFGKLALMALILIWAGILVGGLHRQYRLLKRAENTFYNSLVQCGFSGLRLLQEDTLGNNIMGHSSLLQYLQQEEVSKQQEAWLVVGKETLGNVKSDQADGTATPDSFPLRDDNTVMVFNNGTYDITYGNGQQSGDAGEIVTAQQPDSMQEGAVTSVKNSTDTRTENEKKIATLLEKKNTDYLLKNFYIVDSSTSVNKKLFQVDALLNKTIKIKKEKKPQILIYHTHGASEAFIDSKKGKIEDSIVGIGEELASELTKKYGYYVIHDKTQYDLVNGKIDRNRAYNQSCAGVSRTLQRYPSIQVVIDLHRDGVGNKVHRLTTIDGKKTAQVMFFNGLSRNKKGDIAYLRNDNLQANLAFSLQMKLACMNNYPDFAKPIYLKNYRYNLHLRERALLIELGNENNTVQEAKNAMGPLAKILDQVLSGK